jgi:hypothetical protein
LRLAARMSNVAPPSNSSRSLSRVGLGFLLLGSLIACTTTAPSGPSSSSPAETPEAAEEGASDAPERGASSPGGSAAAGKPKPPKPKLPTTPPDLDPYGHVLFLDFNGSPLAYGQTDGPNSVASLSEQQIDTVIPPFMHDKLGSSRGDVIESLTQAVRDLYAPFDVQVVRRKPAIASYTRLLVGGDRKRDADWDQPGAVGVTSTAACTAADITERGLGFAFSSTIFDDPTGSTSGLIRTMAHEAGHMFGLVHASPGASLMAPNTGGPPQWGAGAVANDGFSTCGRSTQDDVAVLTANLGEVRSDRLPVPLLDDTPPSIASVSPLDGSSIAAGFTPCVTASSSAGIRMAMLEVFKTQATVPPTLTKRLHAEAKLGPPFVFAPYSLIASGMVYRFTVLDVNGNVSEARSTVTVQASGNAAPPCL